MNRASIAAETARRHRIARQRLADLSAEIEGLGGAPARDCLYAASLAGIAALEARARPLREAADDRERLRKVREGRP